MKEHKIGELIDGDKREVLIMKGAWLVLAKLAVLVLVIGIPVTVGAINWINKELHRNDLRITRLEDWKEGRPVFVTPSDAQNLELRIKEEVTKNTTLKTEAIMNSLAKLQLDVTELKILLEEHKRQTTTRP